MHCWHHDSSNFKHLGPILENRPEAAAETAACNALWCQVRLQLVTYRFQAVPFALKQQVKVSPSLMFNPFCIASHSWAFF